MNGIKNFKNMYSILTICLILVGAVLLIAPGIALDVVCIIFGIYMIIYGAVKIMGYFANQLAFQFDLALGIVIAIVGIVFVCRTARVVQLLSTCIGIVMLVDATFKIQTSIDSKRFGISRWWLMLILAVIVAAIGILLILMPGETTRLMVRLIGLNLCMDGILNLVIVIDTVKTDKALRQ